ncbi:phospholipase-like protein [Tanacetum coccineum]
MDLSNYKVPRVLVTCRSMLGLIKTIRDLIRGTPWEALFEKTCFGWLLDKREWTENCILVHFMLCRQIEVLGDENDVVPLKYHIVENFKIQFDREEFCLITGLKFGVEYWADYNDEDEPIPFRRQVFPSSLDGKPIKGNTVLQVIKSKMFDQLYDDDAVSLCCVGILQLVLLGVEDRRAVPDWILRLANDRDGWDKYPWGSCVWPTLYSQLKNANVKRIQDVDIGVFLRTGGGVLYMSQASSSSSCLEFKWEGHLPAERLTPDEIEDRFGWWVSSRAFFDGRISIAERIPRHLNRQNHYEVPSQFYREYVYGGYDSWIGATSKTRCQHYGLSDFSGFQSMQGGPSTFQTPTNSSFYEVGQAGPFYAYNIPSQLANPNWQPHIQVHQHDDILFDPNIMNRPRRKHHPSIYRQGPYMDLPPTTILPKKRGGKSKNKVKKANVSPFNLRSAFNDEDVEGDDVMITGEQDTGIYFTYENVDPNKGDGSTLVLLEECRTGVKRRSESSISRLNSHGSFLLLKLESI